MSIFVATITIAAKVRAIDEEEGTKDVQAPHEVYRRRPQQKNTKDVGVRGEHGPKRKRITICTHTAIGTP